ncbi:MAG: acyl-CoA carboxylase subunit beta [Propionibacteriales bacterium]|uniref:acyl-CoA carboxylase subunit beta n=1 Tax=Aeromicrobium sp. CnD17-E TaxID=2954487 RepID=UPI0020985CE8|nr:acyl-CoA carboxylase subunit beta [Aeromicrobium sp. CnD17-E]MCO7238632.1 acyl-CoA carboxylase subunit beta [Aeromicrobium sp. CnD17-E]MCX6406489.1 acyl-CoA carboxylase subunit beta [Propionibacteriales bacterium]
MHDVPMGADMRVQVKALDKLRQEARGDHDEIGTRRQHEKGKLTVRERIDLLFDPGSFVEIDTFRRHRSTSLGLADKKPLTDGVVTGWGDIHGRRVFVYAHDFRIFGGSLGEEHAKKIQKVLDLALRARCPVISLNDGAGARIQEGVAALAGYGGIFTRIVKASGVVPQISVMLGPCAGGAAYAPALTDFVFMVDGSSQMFVTGPDVIKAVTGELISQDQLGGARVHCETSGVAHGFYDDERTCLEEVRYLVSMLPQNSSSAPTPYVLEDPVDRESPELLDLVPTSPTASYDMRDVIECLVDDGELFEVHAHWARNIVCCLARMGGRVVGIVANQPQVLAGALDIDASDKGARFVQMCDSFRIPLLTLVDVPGFLPGVHQEHHGLIRHGAKLLYAYCNATVPRVSVVVRKAYGGAFIVMDSQSVGADVALAWPTNEVAVMGPDAAANVIFRREIAAADDGVGEHRRRVEQYREEFMHPFYAAERGLVEDVIDPAHTRRIVIDCFRSLAGETDLGVPASAHGNPPT